MMPRRELLPLSLLLLSLFSIVTHARAQSPAGDANDWPRWRGSNFNDAVRVGGVFSEPFELKEVWEAEIGSGYSGISVLGGRVVTMGSIDGQDHVLALDGSSGKILWQLRIGDSYPGRDGAQDGPVSTPTLYEDSVYALGPFGHLLAIDLATGEKRWEVNLVEEFSARTPHWGFTTAPMVWGELLIVQIGGGEGQTVAAFERGSGELFWAAGTDLVDYQSPMPMTVGGEEIVLCAGEKDLLGLSPETGDEVFRVPHGGDGFYPKVLHPLLIAEDRLFVKHKRAEAKLLQVNEDQGELRFETLWTSRHIKLNYNQPVFHEGFIYGHSSSFLTCIDAETGELMWKSRPPGNGWMVLVDGHLVVLTKPGSLSVHPASPDGFEVIAQIDLLEKVTWTPPVFAGGKIYARDSFSKLSCVEIAPVDLALPVAEEIPEIPGRIVAEFARELRASDDKGAMIDAFFAEHEQSPLIEDRRIAHFFFRGEAEDLAIAGDMLEDGELAPMQQLAGTDLYLRSFEFEPDARVGYVFVRNLEENLTDPRNSRTTLSEEQVQVSELLMPEREAPTVQVVAEADLQGKLEHFFVDSPVVPVGGLTWGGQRRVEVYLPEGYADGDDSYPVIYVNDAQRAMQELGMPRLMDAAREEGAAPAILVMIHMRSAYEFARSCREQYRDLVCEDIVREVDRRYRTRAQAENRALFGVSEGANGALYIGLSRSDLFGFIAAQSVYLGSAQGEAELRELAKKADALPMIYLDWGIYDSRSRNSDKNTRLFSQRFAEYLKSAAAQVIAREAHDGNSYGSWRERLPHALASFLSSQ